MFPWSSTLAFVVVSISANVVMSEKDPPLLVTGFTKQEKQKILDFHNYYRARVARGVEAKQPKAANMMAMEWDDRLARSAQQWASTCTGGHNKHEDRRFKPYQYTGQNYAGNYGVLGSIRAWYNEVTDGKFRFDTSSCNTVCGHYTQVVWSNSYLTGCGQNKCESLHYVYCDYAPGGNLFHDNKQDPPYRKGEPCSQCPEGFGYCMEGALCASKRACDKSDSKCECKITSCQNGGTFDKANCQCKCPETYEGLTCEGWDMNSPLPCHNGNDVECKDKDPVTCAAFKAECSWDAEMSTWMESDCRKTCGKCGAFKDPGLTNRDGIKTNVKDMSSEAKGEMGKVESKSNESKPTSVDQKPQPKSANEKQPAPKKTEQKNALNLDKITNSVAGKATNLIKGNCENKYSSDMACESWKDKCKSRPDVMSPACDKTCGKCRASDPNCKNTYDTERDCESFANRGDCDQEGGWTRINCAKSCNACP